jgi:methylated-DNA-protein-cysteine methyltransferase related protein
VRGDGCWSFVVSKKRCSRFVGCRFVKRKTQSLAGRRRNAPEETRARVVRCIRALPPGMVSSYGAIARAAGWPGAARQVVRILQQVPGLPWHRVVGSGGAIKLGGEGAAEQRFRLRMEGVAFRGARVDMKRHEFKFSKGKPPRGKRARR